MPPEISAIIVFALMWALILYSAYRLYTWLFRHDRAVREGNAPYEHGL